MSRKINKHDSERILKDFLSRKNEAIDDFDRDALEGFQTLSNENEAIQLKTDLDQRVSEKLFTNQKNTPRSAWLAAAALILLVGFSVYFLMNSVKPKDLALTETKQQEKTIEPSPSMENNAPLPLKETINTPSSPDKKKDSNTPNDDQISSRAVNGSGKPDKFKTVLPSQKSPETSEERKEIKEYELQTSQPDNIINNQDAPEESIIQPPMPAKDKKTEMKPTGALSKSARKAAPTSAPPSIQADVTYPGGYEALRLQIKEKLLKKEINERFEAILYINKKGEVEKVVFTKVFELTDVQQKTIIKVLKSLSDFQYNAIEGLVEYPVSI